jgi:hypothetical protein
MDDTARLLARQAYDLVDPAAAVGVVGSQENWRGLPGVQGSSAWQLFSDKAEKPGWICTLKGALLKIPVRFGEHPRLAITTLKGYAGIGNLRVTVNRKKTIIRGLWPAGHEQVTVAYTTWYIAAHNNNQDDEDGDSGPKGDGDRGVTGFGVKPNSEHVVSIEFLGCKGCKAKDCEACKAKVIAVATC